MTEFGEQPQTREQRRRHTEGAILAAARELFAERGFERTTIRAVAAAAGIDPAMVMQHFGSKDGLFAAAARSTVEHQELVDATAEQLAHAALQHVLAAYEDPQRRESAVALLRSSLTHPAALTVLRDEVIDPAQASVAQTIAGPDAELRAALLNACTLGLTIARYILQIPALMQASPDDLERVLEPALHAIVTPPSSPNARQP